MDVKEEKIPVSGHEHLNLSICDRARLLSGTSFIIVDIDWADYHAEATDTAIIKRLCKYQYSERVRVIEALRHCPPTVYRVVQPHFK